MLALGVLTVLVRGPLTGIGSRRAAGEQNSFIFTSNMKMDLKKTKQNQHFKGTFAKNLQFFNKNEGQRLSKASGAPGLHDAAQMALGCLPEGTRRY